MLQPIDFDIRNCRLEIDSFQQLLNDHFELRESEDILPFFRNNDHISALIGSIAPNISKYDLLRHEFFLFGKYRCDLVIGDSNSRAFCFVEFEDAKENSIFLRRSRYVKSDAKKFSARFEHGYSQILDWYNIMDDQRRTTLLESTFGGQVNYLHGLLVIGRDRFVEDEISRNKLRWRSECINVNTNSVSIITYDQLYTMLNDKLSFIEGMI